MNPSRELQHLMSRRSCVMPIEQYRDLDRYLTVTEPHSIFFTFREKSVAICKSLWSEFHQAVKENIWCWEETPEGMAERLNRYEAILDFHDHMVAGCLCEELECPDDFTGSPTINHPFE